MMRCARMIGVGVCLSASVFIARGAGEGEPGHAPVRLHAILPAHDQPVRIAGRLPTGDDVVLALSPFTIVTERTRFVLGRKGGEDAPLAFDPASVRLLRGTVEGRPGSSVFLALSAYGSRGSVDLGPGADSFALTGGGVDGAGALELDVTVRNGSRAGWPAPVVCGVGEAPPAPLARAELARAAALGLPGLEGPQSEGPVRWRQQLQLAVETDYEYFEQLGGDADAAAAYIVVMYGAVSDVYMRDVNTRMDLSFVRLWETPDDLFNEPEPLSPFRDYWNENMGDVVRDTAQFCSGRRDLSAGGVAWVEGLCNDRSYSWVGYVGGYEEALGGPIPSDYDVSVAAHELGHNCGVYHNHDYGLDECDDPSTQPKRGGIMSYCGQTFSGGKGNTDMRFETLLQDIMWAYIVDRNCIANDCNGNGVRDGLDIQNGTSGDSNGNGEPDECEDCNGNGVLDGADIAGGGSLDLNGNGLPDECEPDCNGNGVPDDADIAAGVSQDTYLDGIPDECQADCDGDGVMDYNQIQADMSLDVDRNAALDSCQDCDGDAVSDLEALAHSRSLWVASLVEDGVREFYSATGVLTQVSEPAGLSSPQDLVIAPTRLAYVSSFDNDRIAKFNASGAFVGDLVGAGGGGLDGPTGMLLTATTLIVSSANTDSVLEFRLSDGGLARTVVAPGAGGLHGPFGLATSPGGPSGRLVVTSADNRVLEFDLATGAYVRDLVAAGSGGLDSPRGLLFKPDGNLLVVSFANRSVLEYDGASGAFIRKWNRGGTADRLVLEEPWGIRLGPDGDVYVSTSQVGRDDPERLHLTKARVFHFDIRNGNFLRAFVEGDDTNLYRPSGFDFMPASPDDCNGNSLPDSCDIAAGISQDANGDGVPDECGCYADCDGSGSLDIFDFLCFQNAFVGGEGYADCEDDGTLDLFDFLCFQNAFVGGCP